MRITRQLLALVVVATLMAVPTAAAGIEPISADGLVYPGVYPEAWEFVPEMDEFTTWAGLRPTFSGNFHNVNESDVYANTDYKLEQAWLSQTTPWANLDMAASAAGIAAGDYDADIASWGAAVASWLDRGEGRSLIIGPLPEMNGDWVPYGVDPANFKLAYLRIRDIVEGQLTDVNKVRWAFVPNGWSTPGYGGIQAYYPGDDKVDIIGLSTYNFGETLSYDGWEPVSVAVAPYVDEVRTTISDQKPVFLAQTASSSDGGDKAQWIRDLFTYSIGDPNVVGLIWFNRNKETDWLIGPAGTGGAGWQDAMTYPGVGRQWPLTDWFQAGPLPFVGPAPDPGPCPADTECDSVVMATPRSRLDLLSDLSEAHTIDSIYYGTAEDIPLMGDWDGDGTETPGAFRPSNGFVYIRNSNDTGPADVEFFFGIGGDIPIVGDWDGDGADTVSIYRNGHVFIKNDLVTGVADADFWYGVPGDRPFAGDFDGDGIDTVGLYRTTSGLVYFRNSLSSGFSEFEFFYGSPSDRILAGDWDGDGDDTVAVYRPADGNLYFRMTNTVGPADYTMHVGYSFAGAITW
jgi:hypothetical protein